MGFEISVTIPWLVATSTGVLENEKRPSPVVPVSPAFANPSPTVFRRAGAWRLLARVLPTTLSTSPGRCVVVPVLRRRRGRRSGHKSVLGGGTALRRNENE
jgi:hypothetical protein